MKKILIITFLIISVSCKGQEPFPYFKFNINLFNLKSDLVLEKYRFSTIIYNDDRIFFDKRSDSGISYFVKDFNSLSVSINIHPFPIDFTKVGTVEKGTIYALRITNIQSKKEMRIYFRACNKIRFGKEINLINLRFREGIYFYDMLVSQKKFQITCNKDVINLGNLYTHKISFKKMKILVNKKNSINSK